MHAHKHIAKAQIDWRWREVGCFGYYKLCAVKPKAERADHPLVERLLALEDPFVPDRESGPRVSAENKGMCSYTERF